MNHPLTQGCNSLSGQEHGVREEAVTIYPEPPIHTVIAWDIHEATEILGLGCGWGAALSHTASSLIVLLRG